MGIWGNLQLRRHEPALSHSGRYIVLGWHVYWLVLHGLHRWIGLVAIGIGGLLVALAGTIGWGFRRVGRLGL